MISCGVCCETVSKAINCACDFDACVACAKRYLLESHEDPHCMSCRRAWGREDLTNNFGPTFVSKTYKSHRENILFERERAMLPATQSRLANYRREKQLTTSISDKKKKASKLRLEVMLLEAEIRNERTIREVLARTRWEAIEFRAEAAPAPVVDRILCGCPEDGCVGFLRSSDHACGACGKKACSRCNLPLGENHRCEDDDIATAKMIRKETKPCPKCNVPIYRASGCPQMFCTQCQCVFDWSTGLEQTHGVVHNPHYFDWLAKNGRRPDARNDRHMACGFTRLYDLLSAARHVVSKQDHASLTFHVRKAGHFRGHEIPRLPAPGHQADHLELRLQFLDKKITEKAFKTTVQREEKKRTKQIELRQIMETYVAAVQDLVTELGTWRNEFAPPAVDHAKVPETVRALETLKHYIFTQVQALSDAYGVKTPDIMAQ